MCPTLLGKAHERNGIFGEFGIEFDKKIKKSHPVNHYLHSLYLMFFVLIDILNLIYIL